MMQEKAYKKPLSAPPADPDARDMLRRMSTDQITPEPHTQEFVASVVIARPRHEIYAFWRDFTNAPKFMTRVAAVTEVDSLSSVWSVREGTANAAQWEMLVTEDEPDRLIAWSTSGNSPVTYSGRIEFQDAAGEAGTQVTATVRHEQHPGLVEALIEAVAGAPTEVDPPVQSRADLARLKQFLEGEPAGSASQPR